MKTIFYYSVVCFFLIGCSKPIAVSHFIDETPMIIPDYIGVTIPSNISPLNFALTNIHQDALASFAVAEELLEVKYSSSKQFKIPIKAWKKLLDAAKGHDISVTICTKNNDEWTQYKPFLIHVPHETIDPYIAYRMIEPGYETWKKMGIYQRNLENYDQSPIYENSLSENNCVNCHSFCMQDPSKMLFHLRDGFSGTMLIQDGKIEKLNTKTKQTLSSLTYPSWDPSGRFVAFSVNEIRQDFHTNDPNRVEVFDLESDVVVYDIMRHEVVTTANLFGKDAFETFPTFSADGKTLYFTSAQAVSMPEKFDQVKYNLCSISFDPSTRTFGTAVDTLYDAAKAQKSVSFPRVSPNGKYLMYTLSNYGNFSIWHKEADLYMLDLQTREHSKLEALNSEDVESYHAWSSNSSWVVFSSRRVDGLYTRPYIGYIDAQGKARKPFVLPQKETNHYQECMQSYNIPEFIKGEIKTTGRSISLESKTQGVNIQFVE